MGDLVYGCGGGREIVKNAFVFRDYSKYPTPIENSILFSCCLPRQKRGCWGGLRFLAMIFTKVFSYFGQTIQALSNSSPKVIKNDGEFPVDLLIFTPENYVFRSGESSKFSGNLPFPE